MSHLTCKVLAIDEVPDFCMDDCIDWAQEMLDLGHETPSLLMLASITKPTSYYEAVSYFRDACRELQLDMRTGEEGVLNYSSYFIRKIALGQQVKENLSRVYQYCLAKDYERSIYDFYLLRWAWDDLDYGLEHQHYWEGATGENITEVTIRRAVEWLKTNEGRLLSARSA